MSDWLEWEDAQGMMQNVRCVGLTPIVVDREVCFATRLKMQKEHEVQSISGGSAYANISATNGEMVLLSQGDLPKLNDRGGVPRKVRIEFLTGQRAVALEDAIFTSCHPLGRYKKCSAAYVEWTADNMSIAEISRTINKRVEV